MGMPSGFTTILLQLLCNLIGLSLFVTSSACNPSGHTSEILAQRTPQSVHGLSIKTVTSETNINVYELNPRRGIIVNTSNTIAPGARLVTLTWGPWSIIATDPLRLVLSQELSGSQNECPLSVYPLDEFLQVPALDVIGERLMGQGPLQSITPVRPLIQGPHFTIADSASGVVAKTTAALWPNQVVPVPRLGWMPSEAHVWLDELSIPIEGVNPYVNDNAFLDFAACYLKHQPGLVTFLDRQSSGPEMVQLPNGQHVVVSAHGELVRGAYRTVNAAVYEIDRDVLHFGIVSPARYISYQSAHLQAPVTVMIAKGFYGLEEDVLKQKSPRYQATSEFDVDELVVELARSLASTDTGYEAAVFELLFNEYDRYGLHNHIITAAGGVIMFDHEYLNPSRSAIPCYQRLDGFRNDHGDLAAVYDQDYALFEQEFRSHLNIPVRVHADGTLFDATQFYIHLLEANSVLPQALRVKLGWVLEHRVETEPILRRLFQHIATLKNTHVTFATSMENTNVCLFYERIAWLVSNQRLPTEAEGIAIMNACGIAPEYSCRI